MDKYNKCHNDHQLYYTSGLQNQLPAIILYLRDSRVYKPSAYNYLLNCKYVSAFRHPDRQRGKTFHSIAPPQRQRPSYMLHSQEDKSCINILTEWNSWCMNAIIHKSLYTNIPYFPVGCSRAIHQCRIFFHNSVFMYGLGLFRRQNTKPIMIWDAVNHAHKTEKTLLYQIPLFILSQKNVSIILKCLIFCLYFLLIFEFKLLF